MKPEEVLLSIECWLLAAINLAGGNSATGYARGRTREGKLEMKSHI